jgi:hypothetical protein
MPQGKCVPLSDEQMLIVYRRYCQAKDHGLTFEWLQWFTGGISSDFSGSLEELLTQNCLQKKLLLRQLSSGM